jgi:two-component system sensor histidine kinase DesK
MVTEVGTAAGVGAASWPTGIATVNAIANSNANGNAAEAPLAQIRRARAVVVTRTVAYAFVVAMLGFGLLPIANGVAHHHAVWVIAAGSAAFLVLALAFMRLVADAMRRPWHNNAWRQALAVTVIALALPLAVHADWQVIGFLAVAAVAVTLRPRYGLIGALGVLVAFTVERLLLGMPGVVFLTIQDLLTGAALAGIIVLVAFVEELFAARAEVARLAVTAERSRFARDLHDTLGHNLSAIALKSELATRLLDVDLDRTRAELIDVHAIARESLSDVRTVVKGYRRDSLEREIEGVRSVLMSAGVSCHVVPLAVALPGPIEEVLAWAVREAATNLLRHSTASRCEITVRLELNETVRLDIVNDGVGGVEPDRTGGSGLAGLSERLAPLRGRLTAAVQPNGEFLFRVEIPTVGPRRNP